MNKDNEILISAKNSFESAIEVDYPNNFSLGSWWKNIQKRNCDSIRNFKNCEKVVLYAPEKTFNLAKSIKAKLVVTHDIYWEDEWPEIIQNSMDSGIPIAIENVDGTSTFQKILRRYNLKRCLDFEHIISQMGGFAPNVLKNILTETVHVHLTSYEHGNGKHHTHFHESAKQSTEILRFLINCGYNGMVVSEALPEYQTREQFEKLVDFYMGIEGVK